MSIKRYTTEENEALLIYIIKQPGNGLGSINVKVRMRCSTTISRPLFRDLLGFDLLELVDLVCHLVGGILCLLAECGNLGLVLETLFLEVPPQFEKFLFTFLVEVDLGGSGTTCLIQTLAEFFQLTVQLSSLLLNLQPRILRNERLGICGTA